MPTLSVQLYSVREQLVRDPDGTLTRLAEIGFRYAEPFGLGRPDRPVAERLASARTLRAGLDAVGLAVSGVHAAIPGDIRELAEECTILGADMAFVAHPRQVEGFDSDSFADIERVDALADRLGSAASVAAGSGLRLGYHNHWFEWASLSDGTTGYDRFWSRAAGDLLAEVDLYWAVAANADPGEVLAKLGNRTVAVHLKDGPAVHGQPQTIMGTGVVDNLAVLRAADDIRWHVVEIDETELDPFELLATNARHLVAAGVSRWT